MNRKADFSPSFVAILLLAIFGFFVALGVTNVFVSKLPDEASQQVCASSVTARARLVFEANLPVPLLPDIHAKMKTVPLLCKTRDVKISGTKDEVQRQIGDLMALCWSTFGEGKYDYTIEDQFKGDTCFPCFTLTVSDIKDADLIGYAELDNWLREHSYERKNTTYFKYITSFENIPGVLQYFDNIEEKKTYQILYSDPEDKAQNGIYFSDINTPPKTQRKLFGYGPLTECQIVAGVQGT